MEMEMKRNRGGNGGAEIASKSPTNGVRFPTDLVIVTFEQADRVVLFVERQCDYSTQVGSLKMEQEKKIVRLKEVKDRKVQGEKVTVERTETMASGKSEPERETKQRRYGGVGN
ncbi:uncharacterized protein SPSK_04688 [Sporothrix schenckii 1099-18]|uniref:Uncharacterized protein n=1 Tax=Sporothrix schenckii 1099-18 TaxID=1397361 RepID=A0A0F2M1R0_SPOSC|nr:uncharacterized protein SPSK_04688 [Sporothrix schenckii 1099-18]KJR83019.1 hypothetical protein SPSK_04688 [Sporothrix schenckii 1099-18]